MTTEERLPCRRCAAWVIVVESDGIAVYGSPTGQPFGSQASAEQIAGALVDELDDDAQIHVRRVLSP